MSNVNIQRGVYTPYNIAFTADNIMHLARGGGTIISPQQCGKGMKIHLDKRHMAAIAKGMHLGKHIKLHKFSKMHMSHDIRGGGFFGNLLKKGIDLAKQHAPKLLGKLGELAKGKLGDVITGLAGKAGKYIGADNAAVLSNLAKGAVNKGVDYAHGKANEIIGHGMRAGCCGIKGCRGSKCGRGGKWNMGETQFAKKGKGCRYPLWPARQGGSVLSTKEINRHNKGILYDLGRNRTNSAYD